MIDYTQADVDRMQEAAKLRAKAELATEAKAEAKARSSEASKRAFNEWLERSKQSRL